MTPVWMNLELFTDEDGAAPEAHLSLGGGRGDDPTYRLTYSQLSNLVKALTECRDRMRETAEDGYIIDE